LGLDMYLKGKKYVKYWEHNYDGGAIPEDSAAKQCAKAFGVEWPVKEVVFDLGYWRKVNSIHNWFVQNVQDGVDDCGEYYVSRDRLQSLLSLVEDVLEGNLKPEDVLPPVAGFFFGSTEVDNWYMEDMRNTKEMLTKVLNDPALSQIYFFYQSSW